MNESRFDFPDLGIGVGLRTTHYPTLLRSRPDIDWFEAITENFLDTGGRPLRILDLVAERYPVVLHGVSLSIGGTDRLGRVYLAKVRALADRVKAVWVSDHVCFTGVAGRNTHDLLPIPYDEATLRHVVRRIREASDLLERPLVLENPSSYMEYASSSMPEWEFIARMAEEADCGLLLDVNNVYVSAFNHGFDAETYLDAIPAERVVQVHLAGHTHKGDYILDTHSDHVVDEVWRLYSHLLERTGPVSTLLEWDEEIPPFAVVRAEAMKALAYRPRKAARVPRTAVG
jgi:hypothetical protein